MILKIITNKGAVRLKSGMRPEGHVPPASREEPIPDYAHIQKKYEHTKGGKAIE
jgi:hypothetical protein